MPAFRRTPARMRSRAQNILQDDGRITNFSSGGVVRSLIDIAIDQFTEYYDALDFHAAMSVPSTASGLYLDLIGESRGVSRNLATTGVVTAAERSIRFYSKDGVTPLDSLLTAGTIPSGTAIQNSTASIVYTVVRDFTVDPAQTEVFVSATASAVGFAGNVGKNVLTSHSLGISTVGVTNTEAIVSGSDEEEDSNYRFRISRALDVAAGATKDALRLVALAFPEVSDIVFRPFADGLGSLEALVIPLGNTIAEDILLAIQTNLQEQVAFGTSVVVRAPDKIRTEIAVQIVTTGGTTSAQKSAAKNAARASIINYISSISLGGVFILNRLISTVLDSSVDIEDMEVLVYRFRGEPNLLRNIRAEEDEVFVLDEETETPIRVV